LEHAPYERLKWRVLRELKVLPSEARAREMTDGDYLWCLVNLTLDDEEELARLCPACRAEAEEGRCPACGAPVGESEGMANPAFDIERYERMRGGGSE